MSARLLSLVFGAATASVPELDNARKAQRDAPPSASLLGHIRAKLLSDEQLAEQLQRGNADALTVLFERYGSRLFGMARRILRNDAEAEDAVQQIFLDLFRSIHQFEPRKGAFQPWLLTLAYHRTFNRRRSLAASRFFQTDPLDEALLALSSPARFAYTAAESSVLVGQLFRALKPRQRTTIELTYYEGLTAEEVSARTGERVRVVRHNLYRGLAKLRLLLDEGGPEQGSPRNGAVR